MSLTMDRGECSACGGELDEGQSSGRCDDCAGHRLTRKPTNQEFLIDLMKFSRFGPMAEVFIMEAVRIQAKAVAALEPDTMDQRSMVSPHLWVEIARDIAARIEERSAFDQAPTKS